MNVKRFLDQELKNEEFFWLEKLLDVHENTNKVTKSKKSIIICVYHVLHILKIIYAYNYAMQRLENEYIKMFTRAR